MTPFTMRQIWAIVESLPARMLLELDDERLIRHLMAALCDRYNLSSSELAAMADYLRDRLSLVRDVAETRHAA